MKIKFLKEKIIYALITIVIFNVAFISMSFAFTGGTILTGANVRQNVPAINFTSTGIYEISGKYDEAKSLDILLQAGVNKSSNCTYNIYFVFEDDSKIYIASDLNTISIEGSVNNKKVFDHKLTSNTSLTEELIGQYEIKADANTEKNQNLSFEVKYDNEKNIDNVYKGHIEVRDMICLNDK